MQVTLRSVHECASPPANPHTGLVYHVFSMKTSSVPRGIQVLTAWIVTAASTCTLSAASEQHYLYVASPGTRNYVQYGGVGILVFDIDHGYKFVRRIPTWSVPEGKEPENVKGIAASAMTGRVYVSNLSRVIAIDTVSGKMIWDKAYEGGCDRLAISPDGSVLYVPQLESASWHVVNAATGDVIAAIMTKSVSHNTIYSADGVHVYLAGLRSPTLSIADPKTHTVAKTVGPFSNVIRPFTVNGANTLVFVNVNGLLGFEVGDVTSGKKLYRVEVAGYKQGPVKRHGCPSHGIAMTPDEKELWVADCANEAIHVFDATVMPPKQVTTVKARDCVGWVNFSIDGRSAYPSTGEIVDTRTKKVVAALQDETGRQVQSEKQLEVVIANGKVIRAGDQFGIGAAGK
jgi:DNA-binding beta-propeller fold protein YncE